MKQALKTTLTALLRWTAYYRMRSIEINLAGAVETLPHVRCVETRFAMQIAIRRMIRELCKARAHYTNLLPVGERRVWDMA
jgi:hypothetical protein